MKAGSEVNVEEAVLRFLDEHHTMTLATARDNLPYAASLFYASRGFTIYFISNSSSQHSSNISMNPFVAITINRDYSMWRAVKGLQIWGKAQPVPEEELPLAMEVLGGKYPFLESMLRDEDLSSKFEHIQLFRVIPQRIRFINNEVAFGYRAEIEVK